MKLKDKKIEVLAVTYTQDAEEFSVPTNTPLSPPLWAYYRQLSGSEVYASQSVHATEEVQFVINWRDDVTTTQVIRYKGDLYDITRVDGFEGYKEDLVVYCKACSVQL
jgi:SPP1 family predicted phage head-tail adaptor